MVVVDIKNLTNLSLLGADKQIQSKISRIIHIELELFSYCEKNDIPVFQIVKITPFKLYECEIVFGQLNKLKDNLNKFISTITNPLFTKHRKNIGILISVLYEMVSDIQDFIKFYQDNNSYLTNTEITYEDMDSKKTYKQISFPNTVLTDNKNELIKIGNSSTRGKIYFVYILEYFEQNGLFSKTTKSIEHKFVLQESNQLTFENKKNLLSTSQKDIFVSRIHELLSNLENKKINADSKYNNLISILIFSDGSDKHDTPPPAQNDEFFRKVA